MAVKLKQAFAQPAAADGYRVLVDRLWPGGLVKAKAKVDEWPRSIAPSEDLLRLFHGDQISWKEFRRRYISELRKNRELLRPLVKKSVQGQVTLLYAAKDEEYNNAVVLQQYLEMLVTD